MPIIRIDVPMSNGADVIRSAQIVDLTNPQDANERQANIGDLIASVIYNQVTMYPNESFALTVAMQQSMDEEQPDARSTLTRAECAARYPARRFTKQVDAEKCSICLQDFRTNRRVCQLPCGHVFCRDCVYRWFTTESCTCPECREPM